MDHSEEVHEERKLSPLASVSSAVSLADAYRYCHRITQKSSSNFYYAFRLLPTEQYNALCAFYAFCRFLDDITDQPEGSSSQEGSKAKDRLGILLDTWREELERCYAGSPRHPISQALADTIQRFPIEREYLAGVIDGVAMDLHRSRYLTFAELYDYCFHVASLVGLVCIEIFGYQNSRAREYAVNLGVAFQLTNILRDVGEDARRGRIYLPQEDLTRFGYSEQELYAEVYNDAFSQLMAFEGERAQEYYKRAAANLMPGDRHSLAAAEAMRLIYQRLLDKLTAQKFRVFDKRVVLPKPYKVWLALNAWMRGQLPF